MQSRPGPIELIQAAVIARRYFLERRSKTHIANEFEISRSSVARILDQALATRLVRIEIGLPIELDAELSDCLRGTYELHHALVVTSPDEPEADQRTPLGEVAAATSALTTLARCTVVQLTGAAGSVGVTRDSVETVRAIAAVCGGQPS